MKKHALIVGINRYEDEAISQLEYAERDAWQIENFLSQYAGFKVKSLIGSNAKRRIINQAIRDLCSDLRSGDLFLFYFAGHAHEDDVRGHLLLASDVQFFELKNQMASDIIPVQGIEQLTAGCGASRVLLLDSCRVSLERGVRSETTLTDKTTRDIRAVSESAKGNPPLCIVCSCSPWQKSHELSAIQAGAFTQAMIDVMKSHLNVSEPMELPQDLDAIGRRTSELLIQYGRHDRQDPWCKINRGRFVLIGGGERTKGMDGEVTKEQVVVKPPPQKVICPICRLRNEIDETFKCMKCGRDYLCLKHYVEDKRCCEECASKLDKNVKEFIQHVPQEITNSIGMKFVLIKAGTYLMGSPKGEESRRSDETQHKVTLTKDFYLQTTEVTRGQFAKFIKGSGYKTEAEKEGWSFAWKGTKWGKVEGANWRNPSFDQDDEHPVVCVSWNDVQAFCRWISQKEGKEYRLPTEAEWEYACRAGDTGAWSGTGIPLEDKAWYVANSCGKTHPVGQKKPNAWGLYDMHGNVWEWCNDWYGEYPVRDTTDPTGPSSGEYKVVRGASWFDKVAHYTRTAVRGRFFRDYGDNVFGIRCARTP